MRPPASGMDHHRPRRLPEGSVLRRAGTIDERDLQECEACGTRMYGLHCKIVCPNCGYKRDCSDP
jgi:hypothetical protein